MKKFITRFTTTAIFILLFFISSNLAPSTAQAGDCNRRVVGRVENLDVGSGVFFQPENDDGSPFTSCGPPHITVPGSENNGTLIIYNNVGDDSDWGECNPGPYYISHALGCGAGPWTFTLSPPAGFGCNAVRWHIDYPGYTPPAGAIVDGVGCSANVYVGPNDWDSHLQWSLETPLPPTGSFDVSCTLPQPEPDLSYTMVASDFQGSGEFEHTNFFLSFNGPYNPADPLDNYLGAPTWAYPGWHGYSIYQCREIDGCGPIGGSVTSIWDGNGNRVGGNNRSIDDIATWVTSNLDPSYRFTIGANLQMGGVQNDGIGSVNVEISENACFTPPPPPPCEGDNPRVVGRIHDTLTGSNRLWQPATDDYLSFSCGDEFATDPNAEHTGTLTVYNAQGRDSDWACEDNEPAYFRRASSCGEGPHLFRFFPPTGLACDKVSWSIGYPDECPFGCTGYDPPAGTITNGAGCEAIVYLGSGEWDNHLWWKLLEEPPINPGGSDPPEADPQAIFCNEQGKPTTDPRTGEIYTAIGCIPTKTAQRFTEFYVTWAIGLGGGVAFALIILAGIMIVTSAGDEQKIKAGKELLTAAIAGLLLLIFSVFILKVIAVDLLKIPGITGPSVGPPEPPEIDPNFGAADCDRIIRVDGSHADAGANPPPGNLLRNYSYETGDFTFWVTAGDSAQVELCSGYCPLGNYHASFDGSATGDDIVSQNAPGFWSSGLLTHTVQFGIVAWSENSGDELTIQFSTSHRNDAVTIELDDLMQEYEFEVNVVEVVGDYTYLPVNVRIIGAPGVSWDAPYIYRRSPGLGLLCSEFDILPELP